jgi:hypothetical protein
MSGSRRRTGIAGLALVTAMFVLPACGGDDDTDTAAAGGTETAAATGNVRLEPAAWDEYVAVRDEARAVNETAIETFRRCRTLLGSNVPADQVYDCLGTAAEDVVREGQEVLTFLDGLGEDVGGACAQATANLHGNVKIYIATVNQTAISVDRNELPSGQAMDSSQRQLIATRAASTQFEKACKPE